MSRRALHILTAEYPPKVGGVSHHVRQVSRGLAAAGAEVHIWSTGSESRIEADGSVTVHRVLPDFGRKGLRTLSHELERFPGPRRMLLQWVPQSFGMRGMNVTLCRWLLKRARTGDTVEIMVHEPWMPFSWVHPTWNLPAVMNRLMTLILLQAAERVWVSAPQWGELWSRWCFGRNVPFRWLPLPTGIPVIDSQAQAGESQGQTARVAYFGLIPTGSGNLLEQRVLGLLDARPNVEVELIGKGTDAFLRRLGGAASAGRVRAHGEVDSAEASRLLQQADVLIQPYSEGANARRSSLVTALAHGAAVITTTGRFTERFWHDSSAVVLVPDTDVTAAITTMCALLDDREARDRLGRRARALYDVTFSLQHAVEMLLAID